jgi:hypothetical protein
MSALFEVMRNGISDAEVAEYVFDVIKAIANIEQVGYEGLLGSVLE